MTKKERYKRDPKYRQQTITKVKEYQARMKRNPDFKALCHVRKIISSTRDKITRALGYVTTQEKLLFKLVKERDILAERVKNANKVKVSKLHL